MMITKCIASMLCLLSCSVITFLSFDKVNTEYLPNKNLNLLSLYGKIIDGKVTDSESANVKIQLKLSLGIKNIGSKPALIFKGSPIIVERKIAPTTLGAGEDDYLFLHSTYPSIARNHEWERIQKRTDKVLPPSDLIRKLAPNEIWTLRLDDWFYISKTNNIDPKSKPWDTIRKASPVSLRITLKIWSADIESNTDREILRFSKMLKQRWAPIGELQLEDITSEQITLDFSPLMYNR